VTNEENLVLTVASNVYGVIAQQTLAHGKQEPSRTQAGLDAAKEAVEVARRLIQCTRASLAASNAQAAVEDSLARRDNGGIRRPSLESLEE